MSVALANKKIGSHRGICAIQQCFGELHALDKWLPDSQGAVYSSLQTTLRALDNFVPRSEGLCWICLVVCILPEQGNVENLGNFIPQILHMQEYGQTFLDIGDTWGIWLYIFISIANCWNYEWMGFAVVAH